jgi:PIN domain nuclease of toxin-antitoxin system
MKGLLDTHPLVWWDSDPSKLSAPVLTFLQDPANTILLSVVSVWEMVIKLQLGKFTLNALPCLLSSPSSRQMASRSFLSVLTM